MVGMLLVGMLWLVRINPALCDIPLQLVTTVHAFSITTLASLVYDTINDYLTVPPPVPQLEAPPIPLQICPAHYNDSLASASQPVLPRLLPPQRYRFSPDSVQSSANKGQAGEPEQKPQALTAPIIPRVSITPRAPIKGIGAYQRASAHAHPVDLGTQVRALAMLPQPQPQAARPSKWIASESAIGPRLKGGDFYSANVIKTAEVSPEVRAITAGDQPKEADPPADYTTRAVQQPIVVRDGMGWACLACRLIRSLL